MGFFVSAMTEDAPQWRKSGLWDLRQRPSYSLLLLASFFFVAVISRIMRSDNLETDEMQQVLHFLSLEWGYGSQPPLYEWLQYGVFQITGPSIAGLSILKNGLLLMATILMVASVRLLTAQIASGALAAFALLSMPTVFLMTQRDLSHTVVAIACICLFFWSLFQALKDPGLFRYIVVGLAVGLGAIAKYNFVIIPLAAMIALMLVKEFRSRVMNWKILATLGAAALVVLPHAIWLLGNLGIASAQTLKEMEVGKDVSLLAAAAATTASFVEAGLKAALPIICFFLLLFPRDIRSIARASDRWTQLLGWTFVLSLALVYVTLLGIGATEIRQKWLALYFVALPIYLALKINAAGIDARARLPMAATVSGFLFVGVALMLLGRGLIADTLGNSSEGDLPYAGLASALQQELGDSPATIVTSETGLAANLLLQFPRSRIVLWEGEHRAMPETPAVFVTSTPAGSADLPVGALKAVKVSDGISVETGHIFYYSELPPSNN